MKDPWNNMENSTLDLAINALQEAQKRIDNYQLAYAIYGYAPFFTKSKGGKWLQKQGVEILEVAWNEIVTRSPLWADVFNTYMQSHKFGRFFKDGCFIDLHNLIKDAHKMNIEQIN